MKTHEFITFSAWTSRTNCYKNGEMFDHIHPEFYGTPATVGPTGMPKNQYRIILRTSKVWCVRVSWGGGGNGCGHGTPPAL